MNQLQYLLSSLNSNFTHDEISESKFFVPIWNISFIVMHRKLEVSKNWNGWKKRELLTLNKMTNKLGYDKLLGVLGKKSNKNSHEQNCSFLACASIVDPYYSFVIGYFFNLKLNRSFSLIVGE